MRRALLTLLLAACIWASCEIALAFRAVRSAATRTAQAMSATSEYQLSVMRRQQAEAARFRAPPR